MSIPKGTRKVTYRPGSSDVPHLPLSGYWLQRLCGFGIGDYVAVEYRQGEIIIRRPMATPARIGETPVKQNDA
jgi:hypothetical protein